MEGDYEKRLYGSPLTSPVKKFSLEHATSSRNLSPLTSPSKESYSDRYIPVRSAARWKLDFECMEKPTTEGIPKSQSAGSRRPRTEPVTNANSVGNINSTAATASGGNNTSNVNNFEGRGTDPETYRALLRNELILQPPLQQTQNQEPGSGGPGASGGVLGSSTSIPPPVNGADQRVLFTRENRNTLTFKIRRESPNKLKLGPYSLSPVSERSQKLLKSPRKQARRIAKVPYKVLDAPELQDDFYLNLVDWSAQNVLAVGLGTCVYLWSALTSQVNRLCDLSTDNDTVSSVAWSEKGGHVAVGTHHGFVQVWDIAASKRVLTLEGHTARVGALAWNGDLLTSGSRDRLILLRDVRAPQRTGAAAAESTGERRLKEHRQEVCGLRWSPDHQHLASGGNDNKLFVWSLAATGNDSSGNCQPVQTYTDHVAAVKAIAWSPHQHGLLASGGGTADRCIRFWNTLTNQPLQSVDTGSQVCNIAWSKHTNELVSTHGYSQNQIVVWKYPALMKLATLTGHTYRVLYLAMSPCGESIVTGAGDETLRFWNVFTKAHQIKPVRSELNLFNGIR